MKNFFIILIVSGLCCSSTLNTQNNTVLINDPFPVDNSFGDLHQSDSIKKYSEKMKKYYVDVEPSEIAGKWVLPFNVKNRSDLKMVQLISGFGAYRSGHVKGHKHSGIDVVPFYKMDSVCVFPVNKGRICLVRPVAPNKTVIIRHKLKDSSIVYSAYTHLKEIYVKNGEEVDYTTKIGVLYTKPEAKKFNGDYDHLHFEIKKRIDDYCCASWLCMSQEELLEYFDNPMDFLKKNLNQ